MDFISKAMKKPAARHDRLLQLVMNIAEEALLTELRLLHVCGVNRFGHVISAVPPSIIRPFAAARDAAVVSCLESIQQHEVGPHSTHALPMGAGGASLHYLQRHGIDSHLGTYYRIAGPLIARLLMMGGLTPRKAAEHLHNLAAALASEGGRACRGEVMRGEGWASYLLQTHGVVEALHESFTPEDLERAFLLASRSLVITFLGEPNNVNKDFP